MDKLSVTASSHKEKCTFPYLVNNYWEYLLSKEWVLWALRGAKLEFLTDLILCRYYSGKDRCCESMGSTAMHFIAMSSVVNSLFKKKFMKLWGRCTEGVPDVVEKRVIMVKIYLVNLNKFQGIKITYFITDFLLCKHIVSTCICTQVWVSVPLCMKGSLSLKTSLWTQFSSSTLTWFPETKCRLSGLHGQGFCPLCHLAVL